jgi:hypothetical protein
MQHYDRIVDLGERLLSTLSHSEWIIESTLKRSFFGLVKEPRPGGEGCLEDSPGLNTTD